MVKRILGVKGEWYITESGNILDENLNPIVPTLSKTGYLVFKGYGVHKLVAQYFLEDYEPAMHVHHIDHNKLNNKVNNLTCMNNAEHGRLHMLKLKERAYSRSRFVDKSSDLFSKK